MSARAFPSDRLMIQHGPETDIPREINHTFLSMLV